ncbi:MAG: CaiB/BaiF CoA transferase family protein [Dehalococcoidia bacterium]
MGPIADLKVLDFTHYIAGPYATKLLADFGADVIKVERPGGDPARLLGPFPGDACDPEKSGTFFYLNTNKRSLVLDLKKPGAAPVVERLVTQADLVVENFSPGTLERLGFGWEWLHERRPDLPLVSLSNFGQDGPYRDHAGTELTLFAYGGEMYTMGIEEREPVKMFGTAALVQTGAVAATAAMAAIFTSKLQGRGEHVDLSIAEAQVLSVDRRHVGQISFEFSGRKSPRPPRDARAVLSGVHPCADGYVEFSGAGLRTDRLREMLGNPEWFADPKWDQPGAFINPALAEEFEASFYPWLYEHTKYEIWERARGARVLCGPLFTIDELVSDSHFRDRGFWERVSHPRLGEQTIPGRPFTLPDSPWEIRRPAPLLGEHSREVLEGLAFGRDEIEALVAAGAVEVS